MAVPRDGRELGAVIAEFLRAAEAGRVRRADGARYGRDDLRALRGALSHVASELGARGVSTIRGWQIELVLDRLRDAGLPQRRVTAVVDALRSLFAFAIGRGLVAASPVIGLSVPDDDVPEFEVPIRDPAARLCDNGTRTRDAGARTRDAGARTRNADTRIRDTQSLIRDTGTRMWEATRTPTSAMLLLGEHVAKRAIRAIVVAFVLLVLALVIALA